MFCSRCGNQVAEGSAFCAHCGNQVAPAVTPIPLENVSPKSRLAVTLLAIFLGWTGAHRFYMGKTATAVLMLLLGIVAIGCYVGWVGAVVAYSAEWEESDAMPVWFVLWGVAGLCWAAVGIWSLVDFIIAVTGNFRDRERKPIKKW